MKLFSLLIIVLIVVLSACSNSLGPNYDTEFDRIRSFNINKAITLANEWKFSKSAITSFITTKELKVIFPDKRVVNIELPDDVMYVAIAPYINDTHTCSTHYLSSCQGEMHDKEFTLSISDDQGQIVFSGVTKTLRNGFFELWLPRNQSFDAEINFENVKSKFNIETFDDSNTCITTVRLN